MKLHSTNWLAIPFVLVAISWAIAALSPSNANALVETGILSAQPTSFITLPGAHGAGVGVFTLVIYAGITLILGPLFSLIYTLDFVWDNKDMVRVNEADSTSPEPYDEFED